METSSLPGVLSTPELQAFATGFPILMLHLAVTFGLLAAGAAVYALLTPWREIALIRQGNPAAAVAFAGVLVGLAIPLAVSLSVSTSIRDIAIWGVATVVLQLLAFRVDPGGRPDGLRGRPCAFPTFPTGPSTPPSSA